MPLKRARNTQQRSAAVIANAAMHKNDDETDLLGNTNNNKINNDEDDDDDYSYGNEDNMDNSTASSVGEGFGKSKSHGRATGRAHTRTRTRVPTHKSTTLDLVFEKFSACLSLHNWNTILAKKDTSTSRTVQNKLLEAIQARIASTSSSTSTHKSTSTVQLEAALKQIEAASPLEFAALVVQHIGGNKDDDEDADMVPLDDTTSIVSAESMRSHGLHHIHSRAFPKTLEVNPPTTSTPDPLAQVRLHIATTKMLLNTFTANMHAWHQRQQEHYGLPGTDTPAGHAKELPSSFETAMHALQTNAETILKAIVADIGVLSQSNTGEPLMLLELLNEMKMTLIQSALVLEIQPARIIKTHNKFLVRVRYLLPDCQPTHVEFEMHGESAIGPQNTVAKHVATMGDLDNKTHKFARLRNGGQIMCRANCSNMTLRNIRRRAAPDNLHPSPSAVLVTEEKFFLVAQCNVTSNGMVIPTQCISLPIVVVSHGVQNMDAEGANLFSYFCLKNVRDPITEDSRASLDVFIDNLAKFFSSSTNKSLTTDHVIILKRKLLGASVAFGDKNTTTVSWATINRNNLPGRAFTFWQWFYSATDLLRKPQINAMFEKNLIAAFMDRTAAIDTLCDAPVGSFVIRFSDSELGSVCVAYVDSNHKVAYVEPWNFKEHLSVLSLADRIRDLKELFYFHPTGQPKNVLFSPYYSPRSKASSEHRANDGYVRCGIAAILNSLTLDATNTASKSINVDVGAGAGVAGAGVAGAGAGVASVAGAGAAVAKSDSIPSKPAGKAPTKTKQVKSIIKKEVMAIAPAPTPTSTPIAPTPTPTTATPATASVDSRLFGQSGSGSGVFVRASSKDLLINNIDVYVSSAGGEKPLTHATTGADKMELPLQYHPTLAESARPRLSDLYPTTTPMSNMESQSAMTVFSNWGIQASTTLNPNTAYAAIEQQQQQQQYAQCGVDFTRMMFNSLFDDQDPELLAGTGGAARHSMAEAMMFLTGIEATTLGDVIFDPALLEN